MAFEKLLIATRNQGKIQEYRELLRGIPFQFTSLEEVGVKEDVEETGATFQENARIKARAYSDLAGLLTLADDSGLEVDALDGRPGVQSARYGGPGLTDEGRVALLLDRINNVPWEDRTARFRCVIAVLRPLGPVETVDGLVEGFIQYEPKGANGFGYDPVFYVPSLGRTVAELPLDEKNAISHRSRAAAKAVTLLESLVNQGVAGS